MASLLQLFANGVVLGSIILLASVGLSLLYGIANFANFAHGEFLTLGAYAAYVGHVTLGLPFIVAAAFSVVTIAVMSVFVDRLIFLRHRDSTPIVLLIVSIGVALVMRSIIRIIWGNEQLSYGLPLSRGVRIIDPITVNIGGYPLNIGLQLTRDDMIVVLLAIVFATITHLFLTRTKMGVAMRATADNKSLAKVTGIDTEKVIMVTWALSGALAALGGMFLAVNTGVILPRIGFEILLVVFAAVILGGIGSPYGAMLGAYVIGVAQEMSVIILEPLGLSVSYRPAVSFLIMIGVLLVQPGGIMGTRGE
ncbi:MAG: branched-chain amino acid ABC transporter permease [Halobacteria archaeon]|nr:branched-chain amino acid ABC transporter permease [Halobacteria archaeon]